jgi:hypothetical protein
MCGGGVAGEYDDGRTMVEEELNSFFGVLSDGRIIEITIRTSSIIPEIHIIVLW